VKANNPQSTRPYCLIGLADDGGQLGSIEMQQHRIGENQVVRAAEVVGHCVQDFGLMPGCTHHLYERDRGIGAPDPDATLFEKQRLVRSIKAMKSECGCFLLCSR
jgi:hypothetical protein